MQHQSKGSKGSKSSERGHQRAVRSAKRQAVRRAELARLEGEGADVRAIGLLKKKIAAADRAAKQHSPENSIARKDRLAKLTEDRDQAAWEVAQTCRMRRGRAEEARLWRRADCGARDGARIAAASPSVLLAMSYHAEPVNRADAALAAMRDAVLAAGGHDRRIHPLKHGVVAGDGEHDDLVERALILMVAAGGDLHRDSWVVIEHDGAGSEQGRHAHVAWCGVADAAHSGAAVAARIWASAAGNAAAAQAPSLGTGPAAARDWENIEEAGRRVKLANLPIPADSSAGGLFLYKGSWSAADACSGETARGRPRVGALAHLFGRD